MKVSISRIKYHVNGKEGGTFFDEGKTSLPVVTDKDKRVHTLISWGGRAGSALPSVSTVHLKDIEGGVYDAFEPYICGMPCDAVEAMIGDSYEWHESPFRHEIDGIAVALLKNQKKVCAYILLEAKDMLDDSPNKDWLKRYVIYRFEARYDVRGGRY